MYICTMISKLQYITPEDAADFSKMIDEVCKAGVQWVQLRIKNKPKEEIIAIGKDTLTICNKYNAQLIINDSVEVCKAVGAHGVHLGRSDGNVAEARTILGEKAIIGVTVNTFEHIQEAVNANIVNYAGLGPYRFTSSKSNLSPVLGQEGVENIFKNYHLHQFKLPVVVIGGVLPEDVKNITKNGAHGVAVISGINQAENKTEAVQAYLKALL